MNKQSIIHSLSFLFLAVTGFAQEPAEWSDGLYFHTFSIAAVDPITGESGVAVTTRVPCVGNGVPWVRAGVGAVATQANTRVEYGIELLDSLAAGMSAKEALAKAVAADEEAAHRQVGVIGLQGGGAQHTGDETYDWARASRGIELCRAGEPSRRSPSRGSGCRVVRKHGRERSSSGRPAG